MARDKGRPRTDRERSLLDRRKYLQLAGTAAASIATFGTTASAASQSTSKSSDSQLLVKENFSQSDWEKHFHWSWSDDTAKNNISISSDRANDGSSSLKIVTPEGTSAGYRGRYTPQNDGYDTQNELYTSCWLYFPTDFDPRPDGVKAGVGLDAQESDDASRSHAGGDVGKTGPENNWRTRSDLYVEPSDPSDDWLEFSAYTYHMGLPRDSYGEHIGSAWAPKGEWLLAEMYWKLNTLDSNGNANADGVLKTWIDGNTVVDRTDMRFTEKIDRGVKAVFGHFHGGNPAASWNKHYVDDWRVATSRDALTGGNDDDTTTTDPGDGQQEQGTVLELVTDDGTETIQYEFTVEGTVERRLNADDMSAETGNDEITDNGDGTVTVVGAAGNGYGDSYLVDGTITSMSLDESSWTVRYDGEEVAVDDLTLPNKLIIDGSDHPRRASSYTFTVSGTARKDADLGSINNYDTISDGEISGRVIGGADGYRFSGEVTSFSLDGPANVRVEDGS